MPREPGPADLAFVGGSVVTMDAARRTATAVAVRDGRVVAVGMDRDVAELVGPRTRRIPLAGRTLMPAFQDAHVHPSMAGVGLIQCPLHDVARTVDAYLGVIRAYADGHPDAAWIVGDGWYMEAFPDGTPSKTDLDRAVPDRPAFFVNRDGHGAWVNSRALEVAGITRGTPDPAHGRIERDAHGEPAGTLHEGAMEAFRRLVPPPTEEDRVRGLELAQAYLHRLGVSAWQDAWVTPIDLEAYRRLAERGRLTARAIACLWWDRERGSEQIDELVDQRAIGSIGRLRATTVKIMQDGVAENYTAAMLEPYLGHDGRRTDNRGLSFVEPEALKRHVTRLDRLGFQVHFHALGDRAVREALDAVEAARIVNGPSDGRHHLAHLQVVDPSDVARFRPLGAVANIQPLWACHDPQMVDLTLPFLAPERARLQYPFGSLHRAGALLAGGSDWTVSTPNVLAEVDVAVTRESVEDVRAEPFLPGEALAPIDAFAAFTIGSAYVNHLDDISGSIEVGKLADLVVLDRDILDRGAGRIRDGRVLLTLVEGEPVHEDAALEVGRG
ncbi:MAG: amidohydrolase [Anaerolinea sp.]|nr:amidohydrolase [Anaerolinea sp.]